MNRMRILRTLLVVAAGLAASKCGGIIDPSTNQVETPSGTVQVGGTSAHPFSVGKNGEISVKFTVLSPVSNTYLGLIWAAAGGDGGCASIGGQYQNNQFAQLGIPGISGQISSGKYCIVVYDPGTLSQPENYTLAISHP